MIMGDSAGDVDRFQWLDDEKGIWVAGMHGASAARDEAVRRTVEVRDRPEREAVAGVLES
jgi:hypothetical protein